VTSTDIEATGTLAPVTLDPPADDPIERYLAAQPEPHQATLRTLRATLRRVLPSATEAMSYAMPTFKVDGTSVLSYAGFLRHCSVFPHGGDALVGLTGGAYDIDKGTLRFPIDRPLPASVVRTIVAAKLRSITAHDAARGIVREFHPNGALKVKGKRRPNGEKTGIWRTFDRNGVLVNEKQY
jgi:uncharacterized protein YdhG (YjbR/CyaY superfamily)